MSEYTFVGLTKQNTLNVDSSILDKHGSKVYSNESLLNIKDNVDTFTEHKGGKCIMINQITFIYGLH